MNDNIIRDYDANGNIIFYRNQLTGFSWARKYDNQNRELYYSDTTGYREFHNYDIDGRLVYYGNSSGFEEFYEYDVMGSYMYRRTKRYMKGDLIIEYTKDIAVKNLCGGWMDIK